MENFDERSLKRELQIYIDENFIADVDESFFEKVEESKCFEEKPFSKPHEIFGYAVDKIDFRKIQDEQAEETFSEKLLRLIAESGEKNSAIYNRANIDRRHFSKICNHRNYQPSKLTALAFAVALKLNFNETQELLAAAGYTLTKNNLADVIISFFIERNFFDVDKINQYLYDYEQPLLGG